jgi:hypothetical protein
MPPPEQPVLQSIPINQGPHGGLLRSVSLQRLTQWLRYATPSSGLAGVPGSHAVPNCSGFVVDRFSRAAQQSAARHCFLTHFHAGALHYLGRLFVSVCDPTLPLLRTASE